MSTGLEFPGTKENPEASFPLLSCVSACVHMLVIESLGSAWVAHFNAPKKSGLGREAKQVWFKAKRTFSVLRLSGQRDPCPQSQLSLHCAIWGRLLNLSDPCLLICTNEEKMLASLLNAVVGLNKMPNKCGNV